MNEPYILGLDTSTTCTGVCKLAIGSDNLEYTKFSTPKKLVKKIPVNTFIERLDNQLKMFWSFIQPDLSCLVLCSIETLTHARNLGIVKKLGAVQYGYQYELYKKTGYHFLEVKPTEHKACLGKGNMGKKDTVLAVNEKFKLSLTLKDNDIADAISVANYVKTHSNTLKTSLINRRY